MSETRRRLLALAALVAVCVVYAIEEVLQYDESKRRLR